MQEKPWFQDIQKMMHEYQPPTTENPDPYNALFFTNYSFHYQTEREADPGEHLLILPLYNRHSLPADFLKILLDALNNYGNVPNLDVEVGF
jgi:hypothetical protein